MAASIRRMVAEDAQAIHAIHSACLTRTLSAHYTPEQLAAWMAGRTPEGYLRAADAGERLFVAETEGRVVAFSSWQEGELLALYVHPDSQRQGIGAALLATCRRDAQACGQSILRVKAALGAEAFYRRHGFVVVERGVTLKQSTEIPDWRMVVEG